MPVVIEFADPTDMLSLPTIDLAGRIRGAIVGRPHEIVTWQDVLAAQPRRLPPLIERLAQRWGIKPLSVQRLLERFLKDGLPTYSDRVADILAEVGLDLAPAPPNKPDEGKVCAAAGSWRALAEAVS